MSTSVNGLSFDDVYRRLGFLSEAGQPRPLHRVCEYRNACWENAQRRYPPDDDGWSHIARPWVGLDYPKLRLLAVGENLNGYGGLDALCELAEEAKDLIVKGFRRVRFHSTFSEYSGSFLWHRLGCYVATIAEANGTMRLNWNNDSYPASQDDARAFDLMAFSEYVKCSPAEDKSKPTYPM